MAGRDKNDRTNSRTIYQQNRIAFSPSESKPLVKHINGNLASGAVSYSSVVGMRLYLSGYTRPDITFAVNCCARYMFCPKHSHELALKRIGCYLKQTSDRGMVMDPSSDVCKIDAYPDADFAGMFGHEDHTDPACTKSRTGFIITFADCPIFWQSKLQTVLSVLAASDPLLYFGEKDGRKLI